MKSPPSKPLLYSSTVDHHKQPHQHPPPEQCFPYCWHNVWYEWFHWISLVAILVTHGRTVVKFQKGCQLKPSKGYELHKYGGLVDWWVLNRAIFVCQLIWQGRFRQWIGFSDLCLLFGRLFRQRYGHTNGTWSKIGFAKSCCEPFTWASLIFQWAWAITALHDQPFLLFFYEKHNAKHI